MLCHDEHAHNLDELKDLTRRQFFGTCGVGVGKIALASLLVGGAQKVLAGATTQPGGIALTTGAPRPTATKAPHFPAKAKRVIYIFQVGAPSQLDLFDPKPMLVK